MPVMMPEKKQSFVKQMLPMAGQMLGAAVGGPVGGAVGGALGGKAAEGKPQAPAVETAAMQRRLDSQASPLPDLMKAEQAVASLPPAQQDAYGPQLRRARMLAEQERGIA
jgi:hypothetical protein